MVIHQVESALDSDLTDAPYGIICDQILKF